MYTFRDSIAVPKQINMGGPLNQLKFEGDSFEFIVGGNSVSRLGNGVTTPSDFVSQLDATGTAIRVIKTSGVTADNRFMSFYIDGGVTRVGGIRTDGAGAIQLDEISTITMKENIRNNEDECYDILQNLRGVKYDFINGNKNVNGFIAEEVKESYPVAAGTFDGINTISKGSLIPVMWSAMRKMSKEHEELKEMLKRQ